MAQHSIPTSFHNLESEFQRRCEVMLQSLRSLRGYYNAEHGSQILQGTKVLQEIIDRPRGLNEAHDHNVNPPPPSPPIVPMPPTPPLPPIPPNGNPPPGRRQNNPNMSAVRNPPTNLPVIAGNTPIVIPPLQEPDLHEEVESLRRRLEGMERNMSNLTSTLKDARDLLASKSKQTGDLNIAQQQYHALGDMKAEERTRLLQNGQNIQARAAEVDELTYRHESAKLLVELGRYDEAVPAFGLVRQRRIILFNDPGVRLEATREVQLDLCNALCLQGSTMSLAQAEELYYQAADLERQDAQNGNNHNWALRNAFRLACLRARQNRHDIAVQRLSQVWSRHDGASEYCIKELHDAIASLLEAYGRQHLDEYSVVVLKVIRESEVLTPRLVNAVTATGVRLYGDRQYDQAADYLRVAWRHTTAATSREGKLVLGEALAWSLCRAGRHNLDECANILEPLVESFNTTSQPIQYRIRALFAYVQLEKNNSNLVSSRQNAQIVYDEHGTQNVLDSFEYHHVDTLIRAMVRGPHYSGRWCKASGIWNRVYEYAEALRTNPGSRQQVERHAATGRLLAKLWTSWLKTQSNRRAPTPRTVRAQADRLQGR